jgi:hypothetical protein
VRVLRGDAPPAATAAVGAAVTDDLLRHAVEIDCARRDGHGVVTDVGGPTSAGQRWTAQLGFVIAALERGEARYFVSSGSQQLGLHVKDGELVTIVEFGWSVYSLPVCRAAD